MTTRPYFPSWNHLPLDARFTVREAFIDDDSDITPGKVYQAHEVGSRQLYFYDDSGRERMFPGSALIPA
jgi:hypothetical protein